MASVHRFSQATVVQKAQRYQPVSTAGRRPMQVEQRRLLQRLTCSLSCEWIGGWHTVPRVASSVRRKHSCPPRAGLDEILNNKVLESALIASVLGQMAKPFTSLLLGKGFNWKVALKSGGMPSSHSAGVTAAATTLGLERGLSDSVFGLAVVLATIVMYDAQGVRNAAGKHAQLLNSIVLTYFPDRLPGLSKPAVPNNVSSTAIGVELARDPVAQEISFVDSAVLPYKVPNSAKPAAKDEPMAAQPELLLKNGAYKRPPSFFERARTLPAAQRGEVFMQEIQNLNGWRLVPLKETIGHTKLEVLFGGIFGVVITLALHSSQR